MFYTLAAMGSTSGYRFATVYSKKRRTPTSSLRIIIGIRRNPATQSTNCEFCYMEITPPSAADCFGSPDRRSPWVFINSTARVYASTKKAYNLHMRKFIMLGTLALLLTRTAEARWRSRPANCHESPYRPLPSTITAIPHCCIIAFFVGPNLTPTSS